jgi:hypothetical protein
VLTVRAYCDVPNKIKPAGQNRRSNPKSPV